MKVLLVNPPDGTISKFAWTLATEPLNLELLAGSVEDEHNVRILDLFIGGNLRKELISFDPDVLCIGSDIGQVFTVRNMFRQAKSIKAKLFTITGGYHPTLMPQDFVGSDADIIVRGPGIPTLREVLRAREDGGNLEDVPGIMIHTNGGFRSTTERVYPPTLDEDGFAARHLTRHYRSKYHAWGFGPIACMRTAEGCPFNCGFCSISRFCKKKYRLRSIDLVIEELHRIEESFIYIWDPDFFVSPARVDALYEAIKTSGLKKKFRCLGSAPFISKHADLIAKWAEIGLTRVFMGLEAATDERLQRLKRWTSVEENIRAVEVLMDCNVKVSLAFIVSPDFSKADFDILTRHVKQLVIPTRGGTASFFNLTPYPGTPLWDDLQAQLVTRDYRFFDCVFPVLPTKLPVRNHFGEYLKLYLNVYGLWIFQFFVPWLAQFMMRSVRSRKAQEGKKQKAMPIQVKHTWPGGSLRGLWVSLSFISRLVSARLFGYRGYAPLTNPFKLRPPGMTSRPPGP